MAYNVTDLVDLAGLKSLTERLKDYTKTSDFDYLAEKVDSIAAEGGEPNKIDNIQVNGTTQTITNKTVNITVPTKTSDLTNDSDYQTSEDVATAVAAIVADAPEAYDTLKEIADWITNHADSAAEMNEQINTNKTDISDLKELIGELPEGAASTTVIEYISEVVSEIDMSDYVEKEEGKGLSSNDYTDEEKSKLEGIEENANNYIHPTYTERENGFYKITVDGTGHVSDVAEVEKSDITDLGIPAQDTTYEDATQEEHGLMSAADKTKLDGLNIATDEEVEEMLVEVLGEAD